MWPTPILDMGQFDIARRSFSQPPAQPRPDCRGDSAQFCGPQAGHALLQRLPPTICQQPVLGMHGTDVCHGIRQRLICAQMLIRHCLDWLGCAAPLANPEIRRWLAKVLSLTDFLPQFARARDGVLSPIWTATADLPPKSLHGAPARMPGKRANGRLAAPSRKGKPCRSPSKPGKRRCKFHGGKSTGAKTPEGRERIAQAQRRRKAQGARMMQQNKAF